MFTGSCWLRLSSCQTELTAEVLTADDEAAGHEVKHKSGWSVSKQDPVDIPIATYVRALRMCKVAGAQQWFPGTSKHPSSQAQAAELVTGAVL